METSSVMASPQVFFCVSDFSYMSQCSEMRFSEPRGNLGINGPGENQV